MCINNAFKSFAVSCILECIRRANYREYNYRELKEDFVCKKYLHSCNIWLRLKVFVLI